MKSYVGSPSQDQIHWNLCQGLCLGYHDPRLGLGISLVFVRLSHNKQLCIIQLAPIIIYCKSTQSQGISPNKLHIILVVLL